MICLSSPIRLHPSFSHTLMRALCLHTADCGIICFFFSLRKLNFLNKLYEDVCVMWQCVHGLTCVGQCIMAVYVNGCIGGKKVLDS